MLRILKKFFLLFVLTLQPLQAFSVWAPLKQGVKDHFEEYSYGYAGLLDDVVVVGLYLQILRNISLMQAENFKDTPSLLVPFNVILVWIVLMQAPFWKQFANVDRGEMANGARVWKSPEERMKKTLKIASSQLLLQAIAEIIPVSPV